MSIFTKHEQAIVLKQDYRKNVEFENRVTNEDAITLQYKGVENGEKGFFDRITR